MPTSMPAFINLPCPRRGDVAVNVDRITAVEVASGDDLRGAQAYVHVGDTYFSTSLSQIEVISRIAKASTTPGTETR